jgi:hemerythrin-like domain-containing protein
MLDSVAEFLRAFGDEHHRKEEAFLFPALEKHELLLGEVALKDILREHDRARALLEKMTEAAAAYRERRPKADRKWGRVAAEYSAVLRRHVEKEQEILYPAAEQLLSSEEHQQLGEALRRTVEEGVAQERQRRFHLMADTLAAEVLPI